MGRRLTTRYAKHTVIPNRRPRIEMLSPRLALSGMVMDAPTQAKPVVERKLPILEIRTTPQFTRDLREVNVDSLPEGVRPTESCPNDPTLQIRQSNEREGTVRVPRTMEAPPLSERDIPEEMRNTDELFGGRDFWIQGSRPMDHVSQQISGPGTEPYLELGLPLAFDPASLLAPTPLGGVPESNLDSFLSNIPSLSDVANDGGFWTWLKGLFFNNEEEEEEEEEHAPDTPSDEDDMPPSNEDATPPSQQEWVDVNAPPWSPPVVKGQGAFWNAGFGEATEGSDTNSGISSLTTHLDKR